MATSRNVTICITEPKRTQMLSIESGNNIVAVVIKFILELMYTLYRISMEERMCKLQANTCKFARAFDMVT